LQRKKERMEKEHTIEKSLPTKKSDSFLNRILALDFDKNSDEESLVIDPDDFSGDKDAQPSLPGDVESPSTTTRVFHAEVKV